MKGFTSGYGTFETCSCAGTMSVYRGILLRKSFLGWRTKILRAADALDARQREGPYRFIQNRSRTSALALKSGAAAEKSKDQLSRDFPGRSIFEFCNNIPSRTDIVSRASQVRKVPILLQKSVETRREA